MKLTKNSACPVCGEQLYISRLSCPSCRAEFPVEESISAFDRLDAAQSEFLYTFFGLPRKLERCAGKTRDLIPDSKETPGGSVEGTESA